MKASHRDITADVDRLRAEFPDLFADASVNLTELVDRLGGEVRIANDLSTIDESLAVAADGSFKIYIPPHTTFERDRFTVAHELGHYWMHADRKGPAHYQRYGVSVQEREANAFAAELLMPTSTFCDAYRELNGDVDALAARFMVSRAAARVRVGYLRCK